MNKSLTTVNKTDEKPLKSIFVIMPFTTTPTRNSTQLAAFFDHQIKAPIESADFRATYHVRRSDETFDITEKIIKDLYDADIVICDLSGPEANPNVMYELGIRLAFSSKPVILIREAHPNNRKIFDIGSFYAKDYDPLNYSELIAHIRTKIDRLENGDETYSSPILKIIAQDRPLLQTLSARRAVHLLSAFRQSLIGVLRLYSGMVVPFLRSNSKIKDVSQTPSDLLFILQKHPKECNKLPWDAFKFTLGSQPALDHYISTRYLVDILDTDVEKRFTECILDYHAHFYSGDALWRVWSAGAAYTFLGEGLIIASMAQYISLLLLEDSSKHKDIKDQLDKLYNQRHIS